MSDIKYAQLNGQVQLPDGDKIAVQVTQNVCSPDSIRIGLMLGPQITWWKGIMLNEIVMVQCQDTQNYSVSQVSYEEFKKRSLNLWKAKALGIHTFMYAVTDSVANMQAGNQYLFEWLKD